MPRALRRSATRVVLISEDRAVLLIAGRDPSDPAAKPFWVLPGGGLKRGEAPEQGARREAYEELGVHLGELGKPVWQRHASFVFDGRRWEQEELYFVLQVPRFQPVARALTPFEQRWTLKPRWWPLSELATTDEVVYPAQLATLVSSWLTCGPPASPLRIY